MHKLPLLLAQGIRFIFEDFVELVDLLDEPWIQLGFLGLLLLADHERGRNEPLPADYRHILKLVEFLKDLIGLYILVLHFYSFQIAAALNVTQLAVLCKLVAK